MKKNQLSVATNHYQGNAKKVLAVCSAGILRSPTTAHLLCQPPYNFNTRAVGTSQEWALIPITPLLAYWADEIVCLEQVHVAFVNEVLKSHELFVDQPPIILCLDIPDDYTYRDKALSTLIIERYNAFFPGVY